MINKFTTINNNNNNSKTQLQQINNNNNVKGGQLPSGLHMNDTVINSTDGVPAQMLHVLSQLFLFAAPLTK